MSTIHMYTQFTWLYSRKWFSELNGGIQATICDVISFLVYHCKHFIRSKSHNKARRRAVSSKYRQNWCQPCLILNFLDTVELFTQGGSNNSYISTSFDHHKAQKNPHLTLA